MPSEGRAVPPEVQDLNAWIDASVAATLGRLESAVEGALLHHEERAQILDTLRDLLVERLGARPAPGEMELWALCPFHRDHSVGSFSVRLDQGVYYCFACGARGGLERLLRRVGLWDVHVEGLLGPLLEELRLGRAFDAGLGEPEALTPIPEDVGQTWGEHLPVLYLSRGHPASTLRELEVGFDPWRHRAVFTVRSSAGCVVGFQTRAVIPDARMRWRWYRHELARTMGRAWVEAYAAPRKTVWYGEHLVFPQMILGLAGTPGRPVLVCEAPGGVLRAYTASLPALASFGTRLGPWQVERLAQVCRRFAQLHGYAPHLVDIADGDLPGRMASLARHEALAPWAQVQFLDLPSGCDLEDLTVHDLWVRIRTPHRYDALLDLPVWQDAIVASLEGDSTMRPRGLQQALDYTAQGRSPTRAAQGTLGATRAPVIIDDAKAWPPRVEALRPWTIPHSTPIFARLRGPGAVEFLQGYRFNTLPDRMRALIPSNRALPGHMLHFMAPEPRALPIRPSWEAGPGFFLWKAAGATIAHIRRVDTLPEGEMGRWAVVENAPWLRKDLLGRALEAYHVRGTWEDQALPGWTGDADYPEGMKNVVEQVVAWTLQRPLQEWAARTAHKKRNRDLQDPIQTALTCVPMQSLAWCKIQGGDSEKIGQFTVDFAERAVVPSGATLRHGFTWLQLDDALAEERASAQNYWDYVQRLFTTCRTCAAAFTTPPEGEGPATPPSLACTVHCGVCGQDILSPTLFGEAPAGRAVDIAAILETLDAGGVPPVETQCPHCLDHEHQVEVRFHCSAGCHDPSPLLVSDVVTVVHRTPRGEWRFEVRKRKDGSFFMSEADWMKVQWTSPSPGSLGREPLPLHAQEAWLATADLRPSFTALFQYPTLEELLHAGALEGLSREVLGGLLGTPGS